MTESSKIRILFVLTSMYLGGVEKSLLALIDSLPSERFEIHVGLAHKGGALLDQIPAHVIVHEIPEISNNYHMFEPPLKVIRNCFRRRDWKNLFIYPCKFINVLLSGNHKSLYKTYIGKSKPSKESSFPEEVDIAVSYQGPSELFDYYIFTQIKAGLHYSWIHFDISDSRINPKALAGYYRMMDRIFIVSEEARQQFIATFPDTKAKTTVFHNIINRKQILALSKQTSAYETYSTPQKLNILTVGRITAVKGQDIAIKAASELKKRGIDFIWRFIGTGNMFNQYKELAKSLGLEENVIFEGAKINPYPYMAATDIYMQPSVNEGFCITLGEAKIFGTPIVSTLFAGATEQLSNYPNSVIVNSHIPEKIADAVLSAANMKRLSVNPTDMDFENSRLFTELLP